MWSLDDATVYWAVSLRHLMQNIGFTYKMFQMLVAPTFPVSTNSSYLDWWALYSLLVTNWILEDHFDYIYNTFIHGYKTGCLHFFKARNNVMWSIYSHSEKFYREEWFPWPAFHCLILEILAHLLIRKIVIGLQMEAVLEK